jgi:hypothetical protein
LIFTSPEQEKLFEGVVSELRGLGYDGPLLRKRYTFQDWFATDCSPRTASLAAFGRQPIAYDTACFVVLTANGKSGHQLVADHRAVGAPLALEVRDNSVVFWRVSNTPSETDKRFEIPAKTLSRAFQKHKAEWRPDSILRAKNISRSDPRQLDFIDAGLIPALEGHLRDKLDPLLGDALLDIEEAYRSKTGHAVDKRELLRLAFWMLAGKVLHDRGVGKFAQLSHDSPPGEILDCVQEHYGKRTPQILDQDVLARARDSLWTRMDFSNLSGTILAHVYENTFVSSELRKYQGIHATPPALAEYVVRHLPIEKFPLLERYIIEPCCGHATFLIAALRRLRELLPADWSTQRRHNYLKGRLWGFEKDSFALEVARLALTLADVPSPNGWNLRPADVFEPGTIQSMLGKASVVLCNPPFEDFARDERPARQELSVHKPAALLQVVLKHLRPEGILGLVLPRIVLDGLGYRILRGTLIQRFDKIELVSLPDKAFAHSNVETVLLLASRPGHLANATVVHHKVTAKGWPAFRDFHKASRGDDEQKSVEAGKKNLGVPDLQEIWEYLAKAPRLREVVEIHRGIEWDIPLSENNDNLVSAIPKKGFAKGVLNARRSDIFFEPDTTYLQVEKHMRGNAGQLSWDRPKILVNSAAMSRGPWRLVATIDRLGLVAYQNLHGIWPHSGWSLNLLGALLNGPLANAYIAAHEGKRHVKKCTLCEIPLPALSDTEKQHITDLVSQYIYEVSSRPTHIDSQTANRLLREIDAALLKGYDLPPQMEKRLLDFFAGQKRPTPFDFGDYFPPDFESYVPLHLYLSDEYQRSTAASVRAAFKRLPRRDSIRRALEVAVEAFEE